jgi:hypothetical protein
MMPYALEDRKVDSEDHLVTEAVDRLFHLSDRFLARTIIGTARSARSVRQDGLAHHSVSRELRHAAALVWDIAPEIARRLGESDIRAGEIRQQVKRATDADLRFWTWTCLQKTASSFVASANGDRHEAWKLLLHDPSEGNPLFIALDRLAPPENAHDDMCARYIAARDRGRGWDTGRTMWTPSSDGNRMRLSAAQMAQVPLAPK